MSAQETESQQNQSDEIERILVLGELYQKSLGATVDNTPGGITVVDTDELFTRNVTSLGDALRFVPGVWVATGSTGDSTFFSSRGSNLDATNYDGNGIKLFQDGLPITAADGNNHNRAFDPLSAQHAVIARGANALTFGASTLGGAINFVTPTARDIQGSKFYLNTGSHGQVMGRVSSGKVADEFDALVTVEAKTWDGFREHQKQERVGVYSNAGWQLSPDLKTRFYFNYINNDQELPGALTLSEFESEPYQAEAAAEIGHYQLDVESWRVANKTDWDLGEQGNLAFGLSFEQQDLYHPIVYNPFFSLLIDTEQKNANVMARYNLNIGEHDLLVGFNYGQTSVTGGNYTHEAGIREDLSTSVDNDADSLELFVVDRWQLNERWKLVYGGQYVNASREVKNINVANDQLYNPQGDYSRFNPRVGLIYSLDESSELFANVSRLYEPPTTYELEDDASADGRALKAMDGKVLEIGTRGSKELSQHRLNWELSVYYGELDDEILSVDDPLAPGTSLSTNVDQTIHAGIEALIGASLQLGNSGIHRIEPTLNITFNQFEFDGDRRYGNNQLPAAPEYFIKGEVLYRNSNGLFIGPTFDIVDERYADFRNSYAVDSYELLGLRAGYSAANWEFFMELRNLLDEEYVSLFSVRDIAARDAAILQTGEPRSVYVGLSYNF